jgi:hypothetical protein
VSQEFAKVIAGSESVDAALQKANAMAQTEVGNVYKH